MLSKQSKRQNEALGLRLDPKFSSLPLTTASRPSNSVTVAAFFNPVIHQLVHSHVDNMDILRKATIDLQTGKTQGRGCLG